ncbi:expressed unknown protein [Seminavis robusta]|uniref:Uncharacterized protein n=1 Tax=Seminavis robusta TaxID=568900 RepID=A0A9N8D7K7_9STRA|nr:expressed unknown protein [Seminavis robusta]|eukprot:Sro30_g019600.1 n/a (493) ;mRNA; r:73088-74566
MSDASSVASRQQTISTSVPTTSSVWNCEDLPASMFWKGAMKRRQSSLFLMVLLSTLLLASLLALTNVPRDEHSPRMLMHPLSSIKHSQPQDETSIRYLTFGSSSTWGEGLDDPHTQAYPWRLSPTVHNVAARVGGISLSAICTQSIVGEGIYDVIVMEMIEGVTDVEAVMQLARRIRQRFPIAKLVFVRLWSPASHIVYDNHVPLLEWWNQQADAPLLQPQEKDSLLQSYPFQSALLNSDPSRWSFADYSQQSQEIDAVVEEVQGYLYQLPLPNAAEQPIPIMLTSSDTMDFFHEKNPLWLSPKGHEMVAEGVQRLVRQAPEPAQPLPQLGTWGVGDACSLWYGTGDYSTLRSRRRASLVDFSKGTDGFHKHAVEISRRGGSVDVNNPFAEPRMLYLTYMTAQGREYPRTKVTVGGKASVMIDPVHEDVDTEDHLTRTTAVGLVPPGRTVLQLNSLDADSTSRFRLVGLHFLNKGKVPIPFEFDFEPDTAHR